MEADKFVVRGDGQTTASTAEAGSSAFVVHSTHPSYSGSALVTQSMSSSSADFKLFQVIICNLMALLLPFYFFKFYFI